MRITRVGDGPIVDASTSASIGTNIQGPSLIRTPAWLPDPLGRYLLYFADHKGGYIRLAHADAVSGPWTVYEPGSLQLVHSGFLTTPPTVTPDIEAAVVAGYTKALGPGHPREQILADATIPHIASPDVHVDHDAQRLVMYFHGLESVGVQVTRAAVSADGRRFEGRPEVIGRPYLRGFDHDGFRYALTMPGEFLRSADGLTGWEPGPTIFEPSMRHGAVLVRGSTLHVLWTRVGDSPESILHSTIDISGDWANWSESEPVVVLRPEFDWEGADAPVEPSMRSVAHGHVNQLRDPAILVEPDADGTERTWLCYAVAGESGIALAEIDWSD